MFVSLFVCNVISGTGANPILKFLSRIGCYIITEFSGLSLSVDVKISTCAVWTFWNKWNVYGVLYDMEGEGGRKWRENNQFRVTSLTALLKYIENIDSSQLFIEVGIKMCQNIYGK